MLVDIPDASVMLVSVLAFLGGLVTLYLYTKIRSPTTIEKPSSTNLERIDYYEKELIDLKIRLDTMELDGEGFVDSVVYKKNTKPVTKHETKKHEFVDSKPNMSSRVPNMSYEDSVVHVLKLITKGPKTSRDIEVTLGKSREHVSRLMKKLFEGGFVSRDKSARPYRYAITENGKERVDSNESDVVYAVSQ